MQMGFHLQSWACKSELKNKVLIIMTIAVLSAKTEEQQARNQCAHGIMSALACTVAQPGLPLKYSSGLSTWADTKLSIKGWWLSLETLNIHRCMSLAAEICFHLFWEISVVKLKMLMEVQSNHDKSGCFFPLLRHQNKPLHFEHGQKKLHRLL